MKRALVALVVGTILSGLAAAYAASASDTRTDARMKLPEGQAGK